MKWNHRIVRVKDGDKHLLVFAEVYYNAKGKPTGYTEPFMCSEELGGLRQLVNRLGDAINHDIIDEAEFAFKEKKHV